MEHTDEIKKERKDTLISIAFIVAIFLFCFLLIIAIIVLIKNIDEIKTSPILYGMEKSGYDMCSCSGKDINRIDYTIGIPNSFDLNYQVIDGAG